MFANILLGATILLLIIGVVGSFIPVLPGSLIVGLTILGYGWASNFAHYSLWTTLLLVSLSIFAGTADFWMPILGAKEGGASVKSLVLGVVGCLVGMIAGSVIPLLGTLIGGLAGYLGGLWYGEYRRLGDKQLATNAVIGGLAGWGIATAIQAGTSLILFVTFLILVF